MYFRFFSFFVISVIVSIYPTTQAQANSFPDCASVVIDVPQEIVERISMVIAFNRSADSYTYLGGNDSVEFPYSFEGNTPLNMVKLSPDGKKLMNLFGERGNINLILVLDLIENSIQRFDVNLSYPETLQVGASWLDTKNIVLYIPDDSGEISLLRILDTDEGVLTNLEIDYPEAYDPISVPNLSSDLMTYAYIGLLDYRSMGLIVTTIGSRDYNLVLATPHSTDIRFFDWSPDGRYIATAHNSNLSNQPRTLTILDSTVAYEALLELDIGYPSDSISPQSGISWSPDGAMLQFETGAMQPQVQILTLDTLTTVNTCISGQAFWSGDGNLIAIFDVSQPTETSPSTITDVHIYDTVTQVLYRLSDIEFDDFGLIVGWSSLEN